MRTIEEYAKLGRDVMDEVNEKVDAVLKKYRDNPYHPEATAKFNKINEEGKAKIEQLRKEFFRDYPNGLPEEYKKNI